MPTGLNASASAITTPKNRRIWLLLIYGPAQDRLATGGISRSLASGRGAPAPTALRLALRPARVVRLPLPLPGSFHCTAPALVTTRARGGVHRRLEGPLDARARGQRIQRAPEASSHASQIRRTQPRRLRYRGPDHGDVENIRLKLAEEVVGGG